MTTVRLRDVYGNHIEGAAELRFTRQGHGTVSSLLMKITAGMDISFADWPHDPYLLRVDSLNYMPVQLFVQLPGEHTIVLPFDPGKVKAIRTPKFEELDTLTQGIIRRSVNNANDWDKVDDLRRAGFLNVAKKAATVVFPNGKSVWEYVAGLREIRQDRCFCTVERDLRSDIKNSIAVGLFHEVSGSLHSMSAGWEPRGSFKTDDAYGNLQVTLFENEHSVWVADIDIDDAAGLGHVFQVVRNSLSGRPTHPYDVHQILMQHQHLDTGYRLELHAEAVA